MKNLKPLFVLFLFSSFLKAQTPVDYNDVAVIINTNSPSSIRVGEYFQEQRNIPEVNIIRITASTDEQVDTASFRTILQQINDHLIDNQIKEQINYLVTTKGVPLKVMADQCIEVDDIFTCTSLDSELTLLRSLPITRILDGGGMTNPYYQQTAAFNSTQFELYLVTRLDGYTEQDVIRLIDRSGPNIPISQQSANIVLDMNNLLDGSTLFLFFDNQFAKIRDSLILNNWSVTYHPDTAQFMDQQDVLALTVLNYNPFKNTPNYNWTRGSVATTLFSQTAETFDSNLNIENRLLIADLIAEGATAAYGTMFINYSSNSPVGPAFYRAYFNPDINYNLAESYFQSLRRVAIQSVIVGDPKTSVNVDFTNSTFNPELSNSITLFPNPNKGQFDIYSQDIKIEQVRVFNAIGQLIFSQHQGLDDEINTFHLQSLSDGIYWIELDTDEGRLSKKMVIEQ